MKFLIHGVAPRHLGVRKAAAVTKKNEFTSIAAFLKKKKNIFLLHNIMRLAYFE